MLYRTHCGINLSEIGFGCYALSGAYGQRAPEQFVALIRRAYELGVTFFDTADIYGPAEEVPGRAVAPFRDQVWIATKVGWGAGHWPDCSPGHVQASCEASLQRLGTEYLDLCQIHFHDSDTPVEETVAALEDLKLAGKIRYYGLGHLPPDRMAEYLAAGQVFSALTELSAVARGALERHLPLCQDHGVGVLAFSVTGRGLLTGKIGPGHTFEEGDIRRLDPLFRRERLASGLRTLEKLKALGARYGRTPVQVAIAWVLAQPQVVCALTGPSTIAHLEENLGGSGWILEAEDLTALERFFASENERLRPEQTLRLQSILTGALGPESAFAGQQETFLDVVGEEAVLEDVKRCWASLWTGRALAYRHRCAIPADEAALAVVVQPMVAAGVAGVLFTANPASGDPDEMVVDAGPGLGDAVVAGKVTPEEIVVNRRTGTVQRHSGPAGHVLSKAQVVDLASLGERIETHFGRPQDVEWAWADGRFYVLQARPITTPICPRLTWEPPQPGLRYMRGGAMELMPEPISVLFETLGLTALEDATKDHQQRLGLGPAMQNWGFVTINGYVYGWVKVSPRMLLDALLALPKLLGRGGLATATPELWERETLPAYRQEVAALGGDPGELSTSELLDRTEALASALATYWAGFAAIVPQLDRAERRFVSLYRKLRRRGDPEPAVLLRGLENRPLQAERALYDRREGDLEAYIAAYGHVLYNLDFAVPLAGEDQAALEAMRHAWGEGVPSPDERYRRLAMEREAAAQTNRRRLPGWLRRLFDRSLAAGQEAARVREDALFDLGLAWEPLRCYALEVGRRLAGAGVLAEAEQVFWLRHDELRACVEKLERAGAAPSWVDQAESCRREREAARGARIPFTIPERKVFGLMRRLVPTAEARRQIGGKVLTSTGTSPGRVTAMARVVHGPEEFERLGWGEILVAHATTPAWTPLFALIGGLVTDLGGALSHGSIIAREYGIPAVMGTGNATERIRDGQVIAVDGTEGRVYLAGRRQDSDQKSGVWGR